MVLTEEQMLMLNNFAYLREFRNEYNVDSTIEDILSGILDKDLSDQTPPSVEEWRTIINHALNDQNLSGMYLADVMYNENTGGKAFCVTTEPSIDGEYSSSTEGYVVFAGTGKNGWRDNTVAATESDTPQQEEALGFVENLPLSLQNITVSGHSKGGNKAMYVTVRSDRIDACYAFDGQGFSQKFMDKYATEIEENEGKIHNYCQSKDFVNILLFQIDGIDHRYYCNGQGIEDLSYYHRVHSLFRRDENGEILYELADEGQQDFSMEFLHEICVYLLTHAPKGEQVVIMSVLGEILQKTMGQSDAVVNQEIIEKYGIDAVAILIKYVAAFLDEYRKEHPIQFDLNFMAIYSLLIKFFGFLGAGVGALVYALICSDETYITVAIAAYLYGSAGMGNTVRDFSEDTKNRMLTMAQEVEDEAWWNITRWDCWYRLEEKVGMLNIDLYASDINTYYRKLIDINDVSVKDIEKIFEKVYEIDGQCAAVVNSCSDAIGRMADKLKQLSESIIVAR